MNDRDPSDPFHHDREVSLEAEIALLRRSLDEAVRRVAEGSPAVAIEHEREIAKGRAALALADTRAAELERTIAHLTARLAALGHSEARYRLAVESARDYAIFTLDLSGRITGWNTGAENLLGWDEAEALGRAVNVIFTPEDNDEAIAEEEMRLAVTDGRADDNRWHLRKDGGRFWANGLMMPMRDDAGGLTGFLKILRDLTEAQLASQHQQTLIHELNHRVKNTLATVQAFTNQSLRTATSMQEAREAITARLIALSRAHDVLTVEKWDGADLGRLVKDALSLHNTLAQRCVWEGDPVRLVPRAALALSMMVHELATNATKYGALSNEAGTVMVSWAAVDVDEAASPEAARRLRLRWQEGGGPPVLPPTRRGFGSRMIERGLANELGGKVRIRYEPAGVVCTLDIPLEQA
ncbi:HWE histidine kinase domain-containing protein [Methylobacterium sp. Leaf117]|uniref:sensor histidine kinase n=1 Tax=Methylobacterium sp. Leaf117 TaxID=1736260 RepID=UPI0006FB4F97|nr:HWE histidine kinase domain-containing protein [Methylobacterium sp. Leaf117]KQP77499.1 histidine kinase [Methylobacterium sp. Leaf117]